MSSSAGERWLRLGVRLPSAYSQGWRDGASGTPYVVEHDGPEPHMTRHTRAYHEGYLAGESFAGASPEEAEEAKALPTDDRSEPTGSKQYAG